MLFLVMSAQKALSLRNATMGENAVLLPRKVEAGPQAGKYVLNAKVKDDPAFEGLDFAALKQIEIDPAEAWPETE